MRAAGYIRVSGQRQAREGESLKTQKRAIEDYAGAHKMKVVDLYEDAGISGKKSKNRPALQKLLAEGRAGKFEAVVVHRLSRLGRNARELHNNVHDLEEAGVKVFFVKESIDFGSAYGRAMFAMLGAIAQLEREIIGEQSIESRIALARKGAPTNGNLPYGRTYDKQTGTWGLDEEKVGKIREAAKRILRNERMEDVAKVVGIKTPHLYQIFRQSCGDDFLIQFRPENNPDLHEDVHIKVPRLLPEATIKKSKKKMHLGSQIYHRKYNRQNLLQRIVYCAECGHTLSPAHVKGIDYYCHPRMSGATKLEKHFSYVRADMLEEAVLFDVFEFFGDKAKRDQAMRAAAVGIEEASRLEDEIQKLKKELYKTATEKKRLVDKVAKGLLEDPDIKEQMREIRDREATIAEEITSRRARLHSMPTEDQLKAMSKQLEQRMMDSWLRSYDRLDEMSFDEKRELVLMVLEGQNPSGDRYGVYVRKEEDRWVYTLKGNFMEIAGAFRNDQKRGRPRKIKAPEKLNLEDVLY